MKYKKVVKMSEFTIKKFNKVHLYVVYFLIMINLSLFAQENVGIGTTTPNASAILDLEANNKGLLIPRLTTAERNAITAVTSLIIFNETTNQFEYYDGANWIAIISSGDGLSFDLLTGGTNQNATLLVGNNSSLAPTGTGNITSNIFFRTGSTSDAVDLATGEVNGILPIANGGTNASTFSTNDKFLVFDGTRLVSTTYDQNSFASNTLTDGYIFVGNGSNVATGVAMSGDATISNLGALTIANNAITNAKVSGTAEIEVSKLANSATDNQIIRTNGTAVEWWTPNYLTSYTETDPVYTAASSTILFDGDAAGGDLSGTYPNPTIANGAVTDGKLGTGINANKLADGTVSNIEFQYLGNVTSDIQTQLNNKMSSTLTSAYIYVGNGSNVATGVSMIGDATIANNGLLTIANGAVTDGKLAIGINANKLADGTVSNTEFQYLGNVTSDIQTQLNNKMSGTLSSAFIYVGNSSNVATGVAMIGDATISNSGLLTIANGAVTDGKLGTGINANKLADGTIDNTEYQYLNGVTSNIQTQLNGKLSVTGTNIGDVIYFNGTNWVALAPGTSGDVLQTNGTGNAPTWETPSASGLADGTINNSTLRWNGTNWLESGFLRNTSTSLAIGNSVTPTAFIHSDAGDATAQTHKFTAGTTTGQTAGDGFDIGIDASGNAIINQNENLNLTLSTSNTERMKFWNDGQIGINYSTSFDDSLRVWLVGDMLIDGDLVVTGNIDPITISMIPQNTEPTAPEGTFYYDNVSKTLKFNNGTAWNDISGVVGSTMKLNGITYTLPAADGNDGDVLSTDGAGTLSWIAAGGGGGNTLDGAYDQGGAGAGRAITADAGAVEISNAAANDNSPLIINNNHASANSLVINTATNDVTVDYDGNISAGGDLEVDGEFRLGTGGTTLAKVIKHTHTLTSNLELLSLNMTVVNVTVNGAEVGSTVYVSPGSIPDGGGNKFFISFAYVSAANTVTFGIFNNETHNLGYFTGSSFYITIIK